jgi:hypothetical protein
MSGRHDPVHAPEHHGLGPVRGGRLLFLLVVALVLVAVVAVWRACAGRGVAGTQAPAAAEGTVSLGEAAQKQAGIATEAVRRLTRSDRVEAPGILALDEKRTARLGSMVEGMVVRAIAEVGDRVHRGQVLAEMHSHVVHDAWADYRKAVAERRRRETEQAFARQNEERAKRLLDDKAISQQDLRRAEADCVAADELLDIARTEVRRAEEALEHLGVTNAEDPSGEPPPRGRAREIGHPGNRGDGGVAPLRRSRPDRALGRSRDRRDAAAVRQGWPSRRDRGLRLPRGDVRRPCHLRG